MKISHLRLNTKTKITIQIKLAQNITPSKGKEYFSVLLRNYCFKKTQAIFQLELQTLCAQFPMQKDFTGLSHSEQV